MSVTYLHEVNVKFVCKG